MLMSTYPWMTEDFVRLKLPGNRGWVYYNWARERLITLAGDRVHRATPGYIAQERAKCLKSS